MCGIVGYIGKEKVDISSQLSDLRHRGPDAKGEQCFKFSNYFVGLGHTRLSIIDIDSQANQPFTSNDGRYVITYNGEIYNYIELRENLISQGFLFRTNSDTEVLLSAYECYGSKVFDYLDGMFAFCILDLKDNKMYCARDHLGIKPLYFYHNDKNKEFYFSSELKTLFLFDNVPKKISRDSVTEFLFNGWLYEPDTGYSQIYKIPPGGCISIDIESMHVNHDIYFDVSKAEKDPSLGDINELVSTSVAEQCISDVPLGIFFSGGVDSTVIASKIKYAQCLSAKYKDEDIINSGIGNDFLYSQQISEILGLSLKKVELRGQVSSVDSIKNVVIHNEELLSDFTYIISEEISRLARKNGYKVMLSGMGADEMFGGYDRYKAVAYKKLYQLIAFLMMPFKKHIKKIKTFDKKLDRFYAFVKEKDFCYSYSSLIGSFSREEIEELLIDTSGIEKYHKKINKYLNNVSDKTSYKKAFYLDLYGFLSHNFMVADKSSMQASIEMRVPLANKDILVKNFHRKDSDMFDFHSMKKDLKLMLKNLIPAKIINRRKTGFNPPMDGVINRIGEDKIRQILSSESLGKYINTKNLDSLIVEHFHKEVNNTYKLWNLVYLSIWIEVNE
jgi:asparagine synthase (glutamine-hydrolysing)